MIVKWHTVFAAGDFANSEAWAKTRRNLEEAIKHITWPPSGKPGKFIIHPESGKKRNEGNGVKPIKNRFLKKLREDGWKQEWSFDHESEEERHVKALDIVLISDAGNVAVEWETGNISSSHRALNKMCLGLMDGYYNAAVLIVPSAKLAPFLTDRIGNLRELRPYLRLWRHLPYDHGGVLEIVEVEQDDESTAVPRIPKGKSGNARTPEEIEAHANESEIAEALWKDRAKAKRAALSAVLAPLRQQRNQEIGQLWIELREAAKRVKNDKPAQSRLKAGYDARIKDLREAWAKRLKEREKGWKIATREAEEEEELEALD